MSLFASSATLPRNRSSSAGRGAARPQNGFALWSLLVLFGLAPLPLASARPLLWTLWAACVGVIATIFLFWQIRSDKTLRVSPLDLKIPSTLVLLTIAMLLVQLLPVGPLSSIRVDGTEMLINQISVAPGQTILMLTRQLTYALAAFLVLQVAASDNRRQTFLHGLMAVILVYGAYGLMAWRFGDTILGLPKWSYAGSITGSFVNRNSFATFLGFGAVLTLAHCCAVLRRQAQRHRDDGLITGLFSHIILYGAAYIFLVLLIIGTQSRMGLFAALVGSAVVVVATLVSIRRLGLLVFLLPIVVCLFVALLWLIGGNLLERIETQGFASNSRLQLYEQVLHLISMRPFIGFGGGTFEIAFPLVHELPLSADVVWHLAHNSYLALWAELGVIAGSFLILAIGSIALSLVAALWQGYGSWTTQIAALGVIVQIAVHSTVDFSLEIPANTIMFVAIVSAGLATTIRSRSSGKTT